MKTLALLLALFLPLLAPAADAPPGDAKDLSTFLRNGLFEEEANRDLDKAAAAYSALIAEYDRERPFAATALFRLAEIRAKQGNKAEAIALHQRLLADFPTHEPLAKLSRERLAALGGAAPAALAAAPEAPTGEEAKELARVREMARSSPDLLNASIPRPDGTTPDTPLSQAARNGWVQVATFLLDQGATVNGVPDSYVPLIVAAEKGHLSMVELLLSRGANIEQRDSDGETALAGAAVNRRVEVAKSLLDHGADPNAATPAGRSVLHRACSGKSLEIVRLLLDKGAKPNRVSSYMPTGFEVPEGTPLRVATWRGLTEIVQTLLDHGADPNLPIPNSSSPLCVAAQRGDVAEAQLLLKHKARVDSTDPSGRTPLHLSASMQSAPIVSLLLEHGASPNARDLAKETPLLATAPPSPFTPRPTSRSSDTPSFSFEAVQPIWEMLLKGGADVNARGNAGFSVLDYTIGDERVPEEASIWLIEHGADLDAKDNEGKTPLDRTSVPRRLTLEKRFVFPKLAKERAISLTRRTGFADNSDINQVKPIADFDVPPTILELLREHYFSWLNAGGFVNDAELAIYRAAENGALKEVARSTLTPESATGTLAYGGEPDPGKWPSLQWGDVLVLEPGANEPNNNDPAVRRRVRSLGDGSKPDSLPHKDRRVTVQVGERRGELLIGDVLLVWADPSAGMPGISRRGVREITPSILASNPPNVWDPTRTLPRFTLSELVEYAVAAEPRAQLGAIKLQRAVDGQPKEWTIDLRGEKGVKELPARLADGDQVIIPLAAADDPTTLDQRRHGIFLTAPGRLLGTRIFSWANQDSGRRTLGEFLLQTYLASEMILAYPDLGKVTVHRLKGEAGGEETINLDLTPAIADAGKFTPEQAHAADIPLEWGDVVELQPRAGNSNREIGLTRRAQFFLKAALARTVFREINQEGTATIVRQAEFPDYTDSGNLHRRKVGGTPLTDRRSQFEVSTILDQPMQDVVRVRLRSGDKVFEFTPEQVKTLRPWLHEGDRVEVEKL